MSETRTSTSPPSRSSVRSTASYAASPRTNRSAASACRVCLTRTIRKLGRARKITSRDRSSSRLRMSWTSISQRR